LSKLQNSSAISGTRRNPTPFSALTQNVDNRPPRINKHPNKDPIMKSPAFASLAFLLLATSATAADPTSWKFLFGNQPSANGAIQVTPETIYDKSRGYGFDPGATLTLHDNIVATNHPFYFTAAVPEGNYNVTVTLDNPAVDATTTVKAELRRLMLEAVHTSPDSGVTRTFTVNVRTPAISTGGDVHLKPREKTSEARDWDEALTLEFDGDHPGVSSIQIEKVDVPTIYILGDSTVCDQPTEPFASWGQMITRFFKPGIAVSNQAESGESLRSSKGAHRFDKVLSTIKPGDFLLIQYGHNDMKEKGDDKLASYTSIYKKLIEDAKAKGASPIVITSVSRKSWDKNDPTHIANSFVNANGDYIDGARQVARDENVPLIDLNALSVTLYEAIGPKDIQPLFANAREGTHHSNYGAYEIAKCIVEGIKANKLGLVKFLRNDTPAFDPAHPDALASWNWPDSPRSTVVKPDGN
jgi:lysophospholipase L1-like esterase